MTPFFTFNCFRKLPWIVYLFAFFIFLYNLDLGKGSFTYCQCCGEEGVGVGGRAKPSLMLYRCYFVHSFHLYSLA